MANRLPQRKQHQAERPKAQRAERPKTAERGYGGRWQRFRIGWLANNPICAECERQGFIKPAFAVDHIRPHKGDQSRFWDSDNWQSLCERCHSVKTYREQALTEYRRVVVTGKPGSGKTTYVQRHRKPGDLVWDWDHVATVMLGLPMHQTPQDCICVLNGMAQALFAEIASMPVSRNVWLIVSDKSKASEIAERISGDVVDAEYMRKC